MVARVYVTLKPGVLDPAGKAVENSLHALGFTHVGSVRLGKFIEVQLPDGDPRRGPGPGRGDVPQAPRQHGGGELPGGAGMKVGIVVFPGSNCDDDAFHVAGKVLGHQPQLLWHKERDLKGSELVILPGGFSYGDYLRCGAIARFSPVMEDVAAFARKGGPVIGICNGFQILTEAGLLPGRAAPERPPPVHLPRRHAPRRAGPDRASPRG